MGINVKVDDFYNALLLVDSLSKSNKMPYALIKCEKETMSICYSDQSKRVIKIISIDNEDDIEKSFMIPVDRALKIIYYCLGSDNTTTDIIKLDIQDNVLKIEVEDKLSEAYGNEIENRQIGGLKYQLSIYDDLSKKEFGLTVRTDYSVCLNFDESADRWDTSILRDNLNKLKIDNSVKNIYVAGSISSMFAIGANQLSQFVIDTNIKSNFTIDIITASYVNDTLNKLKDTDYIIVQLHNDGQFISFTSEDRKCGIWVLSGRANSGDAMRYGIFTNPEFSYGAYSGMCLKDVLKKYADLVTSEDNNSNQRFSIVKHGDYAEVKFNLVSAGGSLSNEMTCLMMSFKMDDESLGDLNAYVVMKTLKDILNNCKGDWVGIKVNRNEDSCYLKICDVVGDYEANAYHYTTLNLIN